MYKGVWQQVLGEIELSVSHASFSTWFKQTELTELDENLAVIEVPNIFTKRQLEVKFNDLIKQTLDKSGAQPAKITYAIKKTSSRPVINREVTADDLISARGSSKGPEKANVSQDNRNESGLNPRYTFDSFIVGSNSDLAYAASQSVAANPGSKYNPLFIYGGVGLGKTHLIQAIGNEIIKNNPAMKVLYTTSEAFMSDFLNHIRYKTKGFATKYRSVDVLIVDDMQFIEGKEKTQIEFFHTFNDLHQANKQIIISSDRPPKDIPTLTERLRSRFEWGMPIDIQLPDFETRSAIIQAKAGLSGVTIADDVVAYLAEAIKTNVRELEGALNQLLAYAEMRGVEPDLTLAEGLLQNVRHTRPRHLTAKQVVDKTARYFQLSVTELCSPKRDKHIVVPRQIAMYLLRSELHLSFPLIAGELGRKDHTTAIHSVEKIERSMKLDQEMRNQVSDLRERLYG